MTDYHIANSVNTQFFYGNGTETAGEFLQIASVSGNKITTGFSGTHPVILEPAASARNKITPTGDYTALTIQAGVDSPTESLFLITNNDEDQDLFTVGAKGKVIIDIEGANAEINPVLEIGASVLSPSTGFGLSLDMYLTAPGPFRSLSGSFINYWRNALYHDTRTDFAACNDGAPLTCISIMSDDGVAAVSLYNADPIAQQSTPTAVSGTAGASYTATEQGMINDLKTAVNSLITIIENIGITA